MILLKPSHKFETPIDGEKIAGHCQFIIPCWCPEVPEGIYEQFHCHERLITMDGQLIPMLNASTCAWLDAMQNAEASYKHLRDIGWTPQQASSVLPNSAKPI